MSGETYLIRSFEHEVKGWGVVWWRPNRCGYTNRISQAGRYSKAEADEIVAQANITGEINEKAVPESKAHLEKESG